MQVTEANIRDLVGAVACHPLQAMMLAPLHALVHETGQSKTAAERAIIKNIMALRKVLLMPYLGTESVQKMYVYAVTISVMWIHLDMLGPNFYLS